MSVAELHPEELLDKEICGELTPEERARLTAHLRSCSACNLERSSRSAFKDDFELVGRAMQRPGMVTLAMKATATPPRAQAWGGRHRRLRPLLLIAAAFLLLATGAAAAKWTEGIRLLVPALISPREGSSKADAPKKAKGAPRIAAEGLRAAAPEIPVPVPAPAMAPEPTTAEPVAPPPAVVVTVEQARAPRAPEARPSPTRHKEPVHAAVVAPAPDVEPAAEAKTGPPIPAVERHAPTARGLYDNANEARRGGDYTAAIAHYEEVCTLFPNSAEARSAEAILGKLFLDRGEPAQALVRFDAYLARGGGALREEALVGQATADEQLGRVAAERAAWQALLAEFPHSAHAEEARARVSALGAR